MISFSANLSLLFTEVALPDRIKLARQNGFTAVEIQFPYVLEAATLSNSLAKNALELVQFNVDADDLLQGGEGLACVPQKRPQFYRAIDQAIAYAKILSPKVINILPGRCLDATQLPTYLDTFKENLRYAAQAFAPLGITTVFEAINTMDMPHFIIHSGEQMRCVLAELQQPNLAMQYDIYHMSKMGENVTEFITSHAHQIGHIQFADCPGRGQPSTGNIDFSAVFCTIGASGYSGHVGAEYHPTGKTLDSLSWFTNQQAKTLLR